MYKRSEVEEGEIVADIHKVSPNKDTPYLEEID